MRRSTIRKFTSLRPLVLAGAVAALLAGMGGAPARADDWEHRGDGYRQHENWREHEWHERDRREHEWREHEWRERHGWGAPRYYAAPGYVYAPPPVVYPPPAYVAPGVNLGFYFR
jgi:hypothetical protein